MTCLVHQNYHLQHPALSLPTAGCVFNFENIPVAEAFWKSWQDERDDPRWILKMAAACQKKFTGQATYLIFDFFDSHATDSLANDLQNNLTFLADLLALDQSLPLDFLLNYWREGENPWLKHLAMEIIERTISVKKLETFFIATLEKECEPDLALRFLKIAWRRQLLEKTFLFFGLF